MDPRDPKADLRTFYEQSYERGATVAPLLDEQDFMYGQVLAELRPHLRPGIRALDLGCNDGALSLYLARHDCRVLGVDLAANAVATAAASARAHAVSGAEFRQIDFLAEWKEEGAFDLVLCSHVIEHVPDDAAFLKAIASAMAPGGALVLMTPTVHSLLYSWYRWQGKELPFDVEVGHLRRYDRERLVSLARSAGLEVDRVAFLDSPLRELTIIPKLLRRSQAILSLPGIRSAWNGLDRFVARWCFPATICIHARRPA
jgi:2-polyprenyl-3-methyl-5-hydroxy-6-metoxy-1,4-benzoquinol methylase